MIVLLTNNESSANTELFSLVCAHPLDLFVHITPEIRVSRDHSANPLEESGTSGAGLTGVGDPAICKSSGHMQTRFLDETTHRLRNPGFKEVRATKKFYPRPGSNRESPAP